MSNVIPLGKHKWHRCKEPNCQVCQGGLAYCVVCGGAEGELTIDCCGRRLSEEVRHKVFYGEVDYTRSQGWFRCIAGDPVNPSGA